MKTLLAVLFLSISSTAAAQICTIPYEHCQLGCPELGGYSLRAFQSVTAATAFITSLDPIQHESARLATFAAYGNHVIVAYRVKAGEPQQITTPIGLLCERQREVLMIAYSDMAGAVQQMIALTRDQAAASYVLPADAIPGDRAAALLLIVRDAATAQERSRAARP